MFDFLENLRRKPEAVRFRIAVFSATCITTLIVVLWLPIAVHRMDTALTRDRTVQTFSDVREPFAEFSASFSAEVEEGKSELEEFERAIETLASSSAAVLDASSTESAAGPASFE
jgi:hypothetical protein